jgi:hypothetical protein
LADLDRLQFVNGPQFDPHLVKRLSENDRKKEQAPKEEAPEPEDHTPHDVIDIHDASGEEVHDVPERPAFVLYPDEEIRRLDISA